MCCQPVRNHVWVFCNGTGEREAKFGPTDLQLCWVLRHSSGTNNHGGAGQTITRIFSWKKMYFAQRMIEMTTHASVGDNTPYTLGKHHITICHLSMIDKHNPLGSTLNTLTLIFMTERLSNGSKMSVTQNTFCYKEHLVLYSCVSHEYWNLNQCHWSLHFLFNCAQNPQSCFSKRELSAENWHKRRAMDVW